MDNESIPLDNEVGEPSAKREKLEEVDEGNSCCRKMYQLWTIRFDFYNYCFILIACCRPNHVI